MEESTLPLYEYEEKAFSIMALRIAHVEVIETFTTFEERYLVKFVGSSVASKPVDVTEFTNGIQPSEGDYIVRQDSFDWLFMRKKTFEKKYRSIGKASS